MDDTHGPDNRSAATGPESGAGAATGPDAGGRRFRRNVVAIGAAVGLTLGGLGIAAAQTQGDPTTTQPPAAAAPAAPAAPPGPGRPGPGPKPNLAVAAKALNMSEADLQTALRSGQSLAQVAQSKNVDVKVVIDALVADAKAKMAEQAATLEQRITEMVNRAGGAGGPGGHGGPGGRGPRGPGHRGPNLAVAAKALNMGEADLATALRSGQSLAQVAQSKSVDAKVVVDALVADAKTRLAEDVKAGRLTQAQADERTATLEQRITEMVNRTGGAPGPRGPRHP